MIERRMEGGELEALMEEQDITQRELAERAGVDDSVISLARRGKRSLSVESERKVAEVLRVEQRESADDGSGASYASNTNSVRMVAGQSAVVDYPEVTQKTGVNTKVRNAGGWRADLVSVAGLENRRRFKRLNQSELARRSGVNRTTISQLEKRGRATWKTARLLASALGIRVEELSEKEQKKRFPERTTGAVAYSEEGTISCAANSAADSSTGASEEERSPVRVELSEPILQRVDRFLDLLEAVLRPRREAR